MKHLTLRGMLVTLCAAFALMLASCASAKTADDQAESEATRPHC
jgi:hypothetical protein